MTALALAPPLREVRVARLLDGPPASLAREALAGHRARLGPRPPGGPWLLDLLDDAGLRGRGGAWFPTGRKWRALLEDAPGPAVVVVNASEGEPLSAKDQTLVATRPHLVLDGAVVAAETIGAEEVLVYLSRPFGPAVDSVKHALRERSHGGDGGRVAMRIVRAPHHYVSGESSAVVRRLNGGPTKPLFSVRHPAGHRIGGRRVLVQNAETLAHVALIARRGAGWFRECGTDASPGSTLMTICGEVRHPGVYEIDLGCSAAAVVDAAGGSVIPPVAALLGGYFGRWFDAETMQDLPLDAVALRAHGASLGCGVLGVLPAGACGIAEATRIAVYLARESAGQCGPCVFGLRAIAETMARVTASEAVVTDIERVLRWARSVRGRGACRHPDGAVDNLESALRTFAGHLDEHLAGVPCPASRHAALPQPPRRRRLRS